MALILVAAGTVFFLVGVGFGIWRGEMMVDSNASQQLAGRLDRAVNVSLGFFFAADFGAALLILKSGLKLMPCLHWSVQTACLLIAASLCSYMGILLVLTVRPPDQAISLLRILSDWMLRIAG